MTSEEKKNRIGKYFSWKFIREKKDKNQVFDLSLTEIKIIYITFRTRNADTLFSLDAPNRIR